MKPALIILLSIIVISCNKSEKTMPNKIIFLHHSTGSHIWQGNTSGIKYQLARVLGKITGDKSKTSALTRHFAKYNDQNGTNFKIEELVFPKAEPYGWNNYPFDYYNIWVKNAGREPFMGEPTLEILTQEYNIIVFKHCFPVCNIQADQAVSDVNSDFKSLSNYKLQYDALKQKMLQFPETKFIVWTGAAQVESQISPEEAKRAKEFFSWVVNEWDKPNDNIFVWDFYSMETEGGLYLKNEYAENPNDSHPNKLFSETASESLFKFIISIK